jgi:hypothetical protein
MPDSRRQNTVFGSKSAVCKIEPSPYFQQLDQGENAISKAEMYIRKCIFGHQLHDGLTPVLLRPPLW